MVVRHRILVGAELYLSVADQGRGSVVVLLHGIPGSGLSWLAVAERLAETHRVLVPDLLGFGDSSRCLDAQMLHAEGQAALLSDALGALQIDRAVVVGHDFGGPVALMLLARKPSRVAGVGLLATNTFTDTPIPFPLSAVTWPLLGRIARKAVFSQASLRMMLRRGVGTPNVVLDPAGHIGDREQARAIATIFEVSLLRLAALYGPIEEALRSVAVPSFVAWGDRDPFFSIEQGRRTAGAIPGSQFELMAGAGHFLPAERPDEVAALVDELARASTQETG